MKSASCVERVTRDDRRTGSGRITSGRGRMAFSSDGATYGSVTSYYNNFV